MPRVPRVVSVWMSRRARDEQPMRCARGASSERLTVALCLVVRESRGGAMMRSKQPQALLYCSPVTNSNRRKNPTGPYFAYRYRSSKWPSAQPFRYYFSLFSHAPTLFE